MKKTLLSIAFALMGITSIFAAKAKPGITNIIQSDGSQLSIRLNGDENRHWYSTSDGVLLVQVGSNYYIAQVEEDGTLKATPQLAHNASERGEREQYAIAQQDKDKFFNSGSEDTQVLAKPIGNVSPAYFPHTGSPKALVILVQFQDVKFKTTDPVATFTHYLKAETVETIPEANNAYSSQWANYGSVTQYFKDMSGGQFTPQFDIVGPVTVSKNSAYYGSNTNGRTDTHFTEMIAEACKNVSSKVNFADYDQNNDGYVDLVYVIYAGYSESMGDNSEDCLWPKSGTANIYAPDNTQQLLTLNGKRICRYGINNEINGTPSDMGDDGKPLLNGIGLFCHEFTHTMGIPDLYPTVESSRVDNQNPEYWDLMDGGEYTYNGYCPTPYSPWEMDVMGWTTPTELGEEAKQVSLNSYANDRIAYKINGEKDEYLLLQNVQKKGWWRYLYGHGLLVWRIDYPFETVGLSTSQRLNNTIGKPNVMIVPADGYVISDYNHGKGYQWTDAEYDASLKADPFPGTLKVSELLSVKLNNSTLKKPIYNIKESEDGVITFDYLKDFTTGIDRPVIDNDTEKDAPIYTLDGRYVGTDASQLTKGIYIIGKKKVVIK